MEVSLTFNTDNEDRRRTVQFPVQGNTHAEHSVPLTLREPFICLQITPSPFHILFTEAADSCLRWIHRLQDGGCGYYLLSASLSLQDAGIRTHTL